jgi:hypothetical protein
MLRLIAIIVLVAGCKSASKAPEQDTGGRGITAGSGAPGGGEGGSLDQDGLSGDPKGLGRRGLVDLDDEFTAVGDIDKNLVKTTVKSNMAKLRVCYEKALLAYPGIEGKCVCTFKVAIDGSVREAKASGVHPDVEACVAEVVRSFKFPTSTAEVEVQYPFTFRAN